MLFIGLFLVLVALVTIGFMWFGTTGLTPVEVDLGVFAATLSPLWLFLLGAASVLVLAVGVALVAAGLRRRQRQRRELKDLRRKAEVLERDRAAGDYGAPARERDRDPAPRREPAPTDRGSDVAPEPATTGGPDRVVRDDRTPPPGRETAAGDRDRRRDEDTTIHLPGDRSVPPEQR